MVQKLPQERMYIYNVIKSVTSYNTQICYKLQHLTLVMYLCYIDRNRKSDLTKDQE